MKKKQTIKNIIFLFLVFFVLLILVFNIISFIKTKINLNDFKFFYEKNLKKDEMDANFLADVFLFNVLELIMMTTEDIGIIFIGTFQDVILILFSGFILYKSFDITYVVYLRIIFGIFVFFVIIFFSIKFFKIKNSNNQNNKKTLLNIFNSFVLLIIIVLLFQILFLGSKYFIEKVLNFNDGNIDIFEQIEKITIWNIGGTMKEVFLNLATITKTEFTSNFTPENVAYIVLFLFSTWFILYMLAKFSISLFQRLIDILFFVIIGFPFAAASSLGEEGNYLNTWNSVMIQKTFKPFLSLLMYLLLLVSMNSIFKIIDNIKVTEESTSIESLIVTLKIVVLNGTFVILNKFSNDWSDNIIKVNTENNIQEFVNNNLSNQKNINYEFNENYPFSNKGNTGFKEPTPGISIDQTLEKINGKDV